MTCTATPVGVRHRLARPYEALRGLMLANLACEAPGLAIVQRQGLCGSRSSAPRPKRPLPNQPVHRGERHRPDAQVRDSFSLLFETFRRTGAASATVKELNARKVLLPSHVHRGHRSHEVHWRPATLTKVVHMLHNPRYAGAFAYGRHRTRSLPGGRTHTSRVARDEWTVLLLDHPPGYTGWADYEGIS